MKNIPAYRTELVESDTRKIQYLFESKGEKSIIKVIEYTPVGQINDKIVYNLGFGDYNEEDGNILDGSNSNNGDMRIVFSTVLNTVPKFFEENKDSAIWVQGSDSADDLSRYAKLIAQRIAMIFVKILIGELKHIDTLSIKITLNYAKNIYFLAFLTKKIQL